MNINKYFTSFPGEDYILTETENRQLWDDDPIAARWIDSLVLGLTTRWPKGKSVGYEILRQKERTNG